MHITTLGGQYFLYPPVEPKKPTSTDNLSSKDNYKLTNNTSNEICADCKKDLQVGTEYCRCLLK